MANESIVFALGFGSYDAVTEDGNEVILNTSILEVFASVSQAVARNEGINITEEDLWFFAYDGSPLSACFSKPPHFESERNKYFPGVYSLHRGAGATLQEEIAKCIAQNCSPLTKVMVRMPPSDSNARSYGWSDIGTMKLDVERALKIYQRRCKRA